MDKVNLLIDKNDSIKLALERLRLNAHGIIFITHDDKVIGCATDGDIRNILLENNSLKLPIKDAMNEKFIYISEKNASRENILKLLDSKIHAIPILSDKFELISLASHKNINWNNKYKIISKAKSPVRISFAGGGTDLTNYFTQEDGVVLNSTINKFSHAILQQRDDEKIIINSNDFKIKLEYNSITDIEYDGKLDLIKAVIKLLNPEFGFELITYSDVPTGSGLGGSAVILSAIIGAFNNFRINKLSSHDIAELAFQAERIELNLSGGWQDQYATVFGGFNFMEFTNEENIINPLRISQEILNELEDSLILCYSGLNHNSSDIHDNQKENISKEKEFASIAKDIAYQMKSRLLKGKLDDFGELLDKAWQTKKNFSEKITTSFLDEIYDFALQNGAIGGKLLGAGGGGYFLFYVPTFKKLDLIDTLEQKGLKIDTVTFDNKGLKSWTTKEKIENR
ncbi:MAG: sugar kinase [Campylobacterota bacterium]|nr:sugar kinase [Campylobacterota bacterium]